MRARLGASGLLLVLLAGTAEAGRGSRRDLSAEARGADQRLRSGMPLLAIQAADHCLEQNPEDLGCADSLGRAAAFAGRCDVALEQLERVRAEGEWRPRSAIAEGVCRVRTEQLELALEVFEEAAWLAPADHGPWLQRALVNARLVRLDDLAVDTARILESDAPAWVADLVELWRAYVSGDPVVDALLQRHSVGPVRAEDAPFRIQVALIDCYRWLDLGDPWAADLAGAVGSRIARSHVRLQACRAEAVRRSGDPFVAERFSDRPLDDGASTPLLDAVLVRALVDQRRLEEASVRLAALDVANEPSATASAWYLARARGDAEAQARFARLVASHGAAGEDLRLLIPVAEGS